MADKSRFGQELTVAEMDASVEELLILEFLIKQFLYSACWIYNDYNLVSSHTVRAKIYTL